MSEFIFNHFNICRSLRPDQLNSSSQTSVGTPVLEQLAIPINSKAAVIFLKCQHVLGNTLLKHNRAISGLMVEKNI